MCLFNGRECRRAPLSLTPPPSRTRLPLPSSPLPATTWFQAACPTCACYPSPVGQLGFALASFVGAGKYLNPSCKVLGLPYISFLPNAKIVSQADAAGLKTGFWTVNDKPTVRAWLIVIVSRWVGFFVDCVAVCCAGCLGDSGSSFIVTLVFFSVDRAGSRADGQDSCDGRRVHHFRRGRHGGERLLSGVLVGIESRQPIDVLAQTVIKSIRPLLMVMNKIGGSGWFNYRRWQRPQTGRQGFAARPERDRCRRSQGGAEIGRVNE